LFNIREYTSLKTIQFSNSRFSDIHSENGSSNDGGIAYIRAVSYEKFSVENCTFEHCTGAKRGGVFYLYGSSSASKPYINLKNVTFLDNSALDVNNGSDIYCVTNTCMNEEGTIIENTCTTSTKSIRVGGASPLDGIAYPDYIRTCPTSCEEINNGKCSGDCYVFDNLFLFICLFIYLFRFNKTCRETCPLRYVANGDGECEYICPPPYSQGLCVYGLSELLSPSEVDCYYYKPNNTCILNCPVEYVIFINKYVIVFVYIY
jgi:hypothetical protein